ncbi:Sensor protein DivL [Durusdinium trenchii]|uniref:histidine kinase n=1 Tax=Durusdinium trenchii TaxID=1381693 RepID=A0ABP0LLL8_9DINO
MAQTGAEDFFANLDPLMVGIAGAIALTAASVIWAIRVSAASKHQSVHWSDRLAEMEARLEKSDAVLSAHPGLVLVWEDDNDSIQEGWGNPKILGGPAALASLLSFSRDESTSDGTPVNQLLGALGNLLVNEDSTDEPQTLREKINDLRAHGVAFSGAIVTPDSRSIEIDGRVAGGQVALWLTDPAARMVEDGAIFGAFRERAADLHGSHALLERAPFPAWRRNASFELVWVNRAYTEAVEAASALDVIKQQIELEPSLKKLSASATNNRKAEEGRIIVNSRGERRVMHVIETPLHGANDAAIGGFATDATELDAARIDLRQHIEANQRTLDQIQTAVAIFGASQNLVYHNAAFQQLWGLEDAELSGRTYHGEILDKLRFDGKLPEPADYDDWKTQQLTLYTEGLAAPGSERDGGAPDEIWHLPDARTLRVAKQRHPLGGVMAVFEDITEQVALEAKFNTQINVQKATLNNLAEGVAVFGADGSLRLHNKAFQKLWRISASVLDKKPHIDEIAGYFDKKAINAADALADMRRAITSKSPEDRAPRTDIEIAVSDGRTIAFGTEALPDGATLVHFLDITDSREREKELKERNAILENADRLKSKFVDHVSYQLRTPLSTIIGFSEMLDGQMFGVLNDRQKDYVASVLSASYHLRDLINDIIDLAAIDAGKLELEQKPTDIRALLENAKIFAALKAEDTQVALNVDCPKDIGSAELDERRVKQVLFNLLSNAFSYSGVGGAVTLGAERSNGVVKIWVEDTGRGISPADQAKIFDAFESRGPSAGAGLGLSLVEKFVKLHGGWVRLDSREGEGARVTCFLPERQPASGETDTPESNAKTGAKGSKAAAPKRKRKRKSAKARSSATAGRPKAAE